MRNKTDDKAASRDLRVEPPHESLAPVGDAVAYMKLIAATYGWSVNEQDSRHQLTREFTLNHTGRIIAVRVTALKNIRNNERFTDYLLIRSDKPGTREHFESRLWRATQRQRQRMHLGALRRGVRLLFGRHRKKYLVKG